MPISFIPLYATLALALSAVLMVPYVVIPALANSADIIRLGFLESIDDPSQLHIATAKTDVSEETTAMRAEIELGLGTWQRGPGPFWVWIPAADMPDQAAIVSR